MEVTLTFNRYRECSRNLWNVYFSELLNNGDQTVFDDFNEIDSFLFSKLVLKLLGITSIDAVRVIPKTGLDTVSIQIQRPSNDMVYYWDDPVSCAKAHEITFKFIEFFDWNQAGWRDLKYYRLRIEKFDSHPELIGRQALLEAEYASVVI